MAEKSLEEIEKTGESNGKPMFIANNPDIRGAYCDGYADGYRVARGEYIELLGEIFDWFHYNLPLYDGGINTAEEDKKLFIETFKEKI